MRLESGRYSLEAFHLGAKIDVEAWCKKSGANLDADKSLAVLEWEGGGGFVFPFGSVVLLNSLNKEAEIREQIIPFVKGEVTPVNDDYELVVAPGEKERVEFGRVVLSSVSRSKLALVALVLAQSTSLEYYELQVDRLMERSELVIGPMARLGEVPKAREDMVKFIGMSLSIRRDLVDHLALLDPPEPTWEDPELDELYFSLRANFDLQSRFRTLEYKLSLIRQTAGLVVELSESRRFTLLELTIIFLIALEIVLYLLGS